MQINLVAKSEWRTLVGKAAALMQYIEKGDVFIVRDFMSATQVDFFKSACIEFSKSREPSWHPCLDGCPDYHRIHHNYPDAYVPSTQHAYYFHSWNERFDKLNSLPGFGDIFELKRAIGGLPDRDFLTNLPSHGPVARIVCHHYPRGGGGQAEHVDPVSPFARIQTLIQASSPRIDYQSGGLYINHSELGNINIDPVTRKGDLILASPGVRHGVAAIDPGEQLRWGDTNGRWIIMPIIIHSDHVKDPAIRPIKTGPS